MYPKNKSKTNQKLLFVLLSATLLISCSKDKLEYNSTTPTNPKPEKGDLSVPAFTKNNPEYRADGPYLYLDSVTFEGGIDGFTRTEHNVFQANETKEYKLEMNFSGRVTTKENESNYYYKNPYCLVIKNNNSYRTYMRYCGIYGIGKTRRPLKLEVTEGDLISFNICVARVSSSTYENIQNDYLEIKFTEL